MDCDNVIDVDGLAKRFGGVQAVADLTLRVRRGEVFGFLGPNGAGKTTSVKLLVGLAHADTGGGNVLGAPLGNVQARRRLGYLPELFRYPDWLSAREVLAFHAKVCGRSDAVRSLDESLALVGLAARRNDRVGTFSKGMQQRLGLAVALLGAPELVVLDEPTSALDPSGRLEVRELVRTLRARGTTVFLNSHLLTEVEQVCDRIAVITKGRVVAQGSIADILGTGHAVRVRATSNGAALEPVLERFGRVRTDAGAFVVYGLERSRIPSLVEDLVGAGAQIFAVEPFGPTLEERFLELTSERGR